MEPLSAWCASLAAALKYRAGSQSGYHTDLSMARLVNKFYNLSRLPEEHIIVSDIRRKEQIHRR